MLYPSLVFTWIIKVQWQNGAFTTMTGAGVIFQGATWKQKAFNPYFASAKAAGQTIVSP